MYLARIMGAGDCVIFRPRPAPDLHCRREGCQLHQGFRYRGEDAVRRFHTPLRLDWRSGSANRSSSATAGPSRLTAEGERLLPYAGRIMKLQAETVAAFVDDAHGTAKLSARHAEFSRRLPARDPRSISRVSWPLAELTVTRRSDGRSGRGAVPATSSTSPSSRMSPRRAVRVPVIALREPLFFVTLDRHTAYENDRCRWRSAATTANLAAHGAGLPCPLGRANRACVLQLDAGAVSAAVVAGLA